MDWDINKTIIVGIGNKGRSDDGIGWATLDKIVANGYTGACEYRYQLNIEDAELISHYPTVLLIDASLNQFLDGFCLTEVEPDTNFTYSTHSIPPATIAHLCLDLFNKEPAIFLLQIQGYDWKIGEGLTAKAQINMDKALNSVGPFSKHPVLLGQH